jgi:hypothetical protein
VKFAPADWADDATANTIGTAPDPAATPAVRESPITGTVAATDIVVAR